MANPWDNTTPTNGTILKDNIPAELIALKQVNLDRLRWCGKGINTINYVTVNLGSNFYSVEAPMGFVTDTLYRGSYNASIGEYTCDQTGKYRITGAVPIWGNAPILVGGSPPNWLFTTVQIQRFTGGVWTTISQQIWVPPSQTFNALTSTMNTVFDTVIQLTNGDKLRIYVSNEVYTVSAYNISGTVSAYPSTQANAEVEFLRT